MYICKRQNEISKHTGIIGTCENFSITFKQNLLGIHNSTYKIDQTCFIPTDVVMVTHLGIGFEPTFIILREIIYAC